MSARFPVLKRKDMPEIKTFVFFDIETTGLPYQEKNQTKIIEFSFVSTLREHLEVTPNGFMPPVNKLTFVLNPRKPIPSEVTALTGITNAEVAKAPLFRDKIQSVISFLEKLPNPVCLVAHNGNSFDFKILLTECNDVSVSLPHDLLCVDSLTGIRRILKNKDLPSVSSTPTIEDLLTDDEDEWPDLNISEEDWEEIDLASLSLSVKQPTPKKEQLNSSIINTNRSAVIKKVFSKDPKTADTKKVRESYKLIDIYKRLLNGVEENAHRAEADCLMLLKCVIALKEDFLLWADCNCKLLTEIQPLVRGITSSRTAAWKANNRSNDVLRTRRS